MTVQNHVIGLPVSFSLERRVDATGVSGTGEVALGVVFPDGTTVVRWKGQHRSTAVYATTQAALAVHWHNGDTLFRYHAFDGRDAMACSVCGHAWGEHVHDNCSTCLCGCVLMGADPAVCYPVTGPSALRAGGDG